MHTCNRYKAVIGLLYGQPHSSCHSVVIECQSHTQYMSDHDLLVALVHSSDMFSAAYKS